MIIPALTGDLLPAGSASASIHVTFQFEGGQHVAEFPCYIVELVAAPAGEEMQQSVFYLETTFSPFVFQIVGHLCDMLRAGGMKFEVVNETPLEI